MNEALARELREELGIAIGSSRPLLKVSHDYAEQAVLLDVWLVEDFRGEPRGQEGQALVWCAPRNLHRYRFPEANAAIVEACLTLQ